MSGTERPAAPAPSAPSGPAGLSRRSVLRVGAASAWTVPLVQVAAAAPAFAASGPAALRLMQLKASREGTGVAVSVSVQNRNSQGSTALLVTVDLVPEVTKGKVKTQPTLPLAGCTAGAPAGWSGSPVTRSPLDAHGVRFVYTAAVQVAGSDQAAFAPTPTISAAVACDVTVVAVPGGAGTPDTATTRTK